MSLKAICSPDFPPSQGYAKLVEDDKSKESYPLAPQPSQTGYPEPLPTTGSQAGYPGSAPGYPQPGYPDPVVQQPGSQVAPGDRMSIPVGLNNCPAGLEDLLTIDQLLVHQEVELLEAFTGFETNNRYIIKNNLGQKVYFAVEDTDCCTRNFCGPLRPFDMKVLDRFQNEVIHLNRPLACTSCCFPCWLQTMEVSSPPGTVIGSIEQEWSLWTLSLLIKNAAGDVVLRIEGPVFTCFSVCGDVDFKVYSKNGETEIGKISKQWSGLARELFTNADFFGIKFPLDLDVKTKAVLLGACFLIDFIYYERK